MATSEEAKFLDSSDTRRRSLILDDEYDILNSSTSEESVLTTSQEELHPLSALSGNVRASKEELSTAIKPHPVFKNLLFAKKHRYKNDGSLRSNFGDLNFKARSTIFDSEITYGSNFFGFFIAFWVCIFFFALNVVVEYWTANGSLLTSKISSLMLKDLWKVGLTDLIMYLSLYLPVFNQLLVKMGVISWRPFGRYLQIAFECTFLITPIWFSQWMDYPWIGQIYLMLHGMVLLMKTHSFAFFNGYLWDILEELEHSKDYKLKHTNTNMEPKLQEAVDNSISFCEFELEHQKFPHKLTIWNFFEYSMFPTLVYETSYPRTNTIRWEYLAKKVAGIFGIITILIAIAQNNLYPIVMECLELQSTTTLWYRIKIYPLVLIRTIPSFLAVYILVFYIIWELILNAIAELSMFADREFYSYWWNSVEWTEYARDWNVPVHKFLLRHVYHSSISALKVDKNTAAFMTFFISSIVHELAMWVIFKKVRGYLLLLQMNQLTLVQLSKTKWLKDKHVLGNCIFWVGIVFGPSLMCTMYLVF